MKLARIGPPGSERPVAIVGDTSFDLETLTADIDGDFLGGGGISSAAAAIAAGTLPEYHGGASPRVGSPIARPGIVVCAGLNYRKHAEETGAEIPTEPILFMKAPRCVIGPNDAVLIPRRSTKTDWEVELAVIIGARAHYLDSPADARAHIAGYAVSNDVSEREFQLERGGQWDKGKSCETFNPLGPYLVPAGGIDAQHLAMQLWVNDELRQSSNTDDMIFGIDHLVWYISQFMVLEPGDVVNTGTPAGVALGIPGQPYLRAGDRIRLAIEGLGEQNQVVGQA